MDRLINGERVTLTPEEETAFLAESNENELAIAENTRIKAIKAEARKRIIAQIPGGTLENYLEKENHLHGKHSKFLAMLQRGEVLTSELSAEMAGLETTFDKMDDIITMSNTAETSGDTLIVFQAALDLKGY